MKLTDPHALIAVSLWRALLVMKPQLDKCFTNEPKCAWKACEFKAIDKLEFCAYHLREHRQVAAAVLHNLRSLTMACSTKKKPKGGKSGKGGGK